MSAAEDNQQQLKLTLLSILEGQMPDEVRVALKGIGPEVFEDFFRAVRKLSLDDATVIALVAASLAKQAPLVEEEVNRFSIVLAWIGARMPGLKWTITEEQVIALSYHKIRDEGLDREGAAIFARVILGRPIDPDAWRKRVDRWAAARNLPPAGKRAKPR